MAEFIEYGVGPQTVQANAPLVLDAVDPVNCCGTTNIVHRTGSGIITLRGRTKGNNQFAKYLVMYFGNIAVPEGGTLDALQVGITASGEPIDATISMVPAPAAAEEYNGVSGARYISVPKGCCLNIALENLSDQAILAEHFNIIVTRTA